MVWCRLWFTNTYSFVSGCLSLCSSPHTCLSTSHSSLPHQLSDWLWCLADDIHRFMLLIPFLFKSSSASPSSVSFSLASALSPKHPASGMCYPFAPTPPSLLFLLKLCHKIRNCETGTFSQNKTNKGDVLILKSIKKIPSALDTSAVIELTER